MKALILRNGHLKGRYFTLHMSVPSAFGAASPGQFVHVRVEDSCDPLLRRPLSIHRVDPASKKSQKILTVLYEVVGKGTRLLSEKKSFSTVDILGPLGRGFDLKKIRNADAIHLVAGGMGVAPLLFLAQRLRAERQKGIVAPVHVYIGSAKKGLILCEKEFQRFGARVHIATEDASRGFPGRVTELWRSHLAGRETRPAVFSCGPKPMLAAVARMSAEFGLDAQVSLEEFMGCGVGACLGCVIATKSGYMRICHDGPVFHAGQIDWPQEGL